MLYGRPFLQKKMMSPLLKSVLIPHLTCLTDMGHLCGAESVSMSGKSLHLCKLSSLQFPSLLVERPRSFNSESVGKKALLK